MEPRIDKLEQTVLELLARVAALESRLAAAEQQGAQRA